MGVYPMTTDQFAHWLQGYIEMTGGGMPTIHQWQMIKDHLQLCFRKVTPDLNIRNLPQDNAPFHRNEPWNPNPYSKPMCNLNPNGTFGLGGGPAPRSGGGGAC